MGEMGCLRPRKGGISALKAWKGASNPWPKALGKGGSGQRVGGRGGRGPRKWGILAQSTKKKKDGGSIDYPTPSFCP